MVGGEMSFQNDPFLRDMLIFGGCFSRQLDFHVESCQGRLWEDEASLAAQAVDNMQELAGVSILSLVCVPNEPLSGPAKNLDRNGLVE